MTDWADDVVHGFSHTLGTECRLEVAAALRKAKADGMNEIADWISVTGSTELRQYVLQIRARAARVEQPR